MSRGEGSILTDLFLGRAVLVVGVEDDPSGALRMYIGSRWKGQYVLVREEEHKVKLLGAWGGGGKVLTTLDEVEALGPILKEEKA